MQPGHTRLPDICQQGMPTACKVNIWTDTQAVFQTWWQATCSFPGPPQRSRCGILKISVSHSMPTVSYLPLFSVPCKHRNTCTRCCLPVAAGRPGCTAEGPGGPAGGVGCTADPPGGAAGTPGGAAPAAEGSSGGLGAAGGGPGGPCVPPEGGWEGAPHHTATEVCHGHACECLEKGQTGWKPGQKQTWFRAGPECSTQFGPGGPCAAPGGGLGGRHTATGLEAWVGAEHCKLRPQPDMRVGKSIRIWG